MSTTLNPITPPEAFAAARDAIDAHEALLPGLARNPNVDHIVIDCNRAIIELLRAQVTAAEAIVAMSTEPDAVFSAGYTAGSIVQVTTSATAGLSVLVKP